MIQIDFAALLEALKDINSFHQLCRTTLDAAPVASGRLDRVVLEEKNLADLIARANVIKSIAVELGLDATSKQADRFINAVSNPILPYERNGNLVRLMRPHLEILFHASSALGTVSVDQLSARLFFSLKPEFAHLFSPAEPLFGSDVNAKFSGEIAEDISQAGKCLAVGQSTACVFHLMRVLESIVQALGNKLDVSIIDKNNVDLDWGIIVANMKKPVEAMPKGAAKDEWSEALTLLIHVKQAWRHPTMHPKQAYTEDEAKAIFEAVKSFTRQLATLA